MLELEILLDFLIEKPQISYFHLALSLPHICVLDDSYSHSVINVDWSFGLGVA